MLPSRLIIALLVLTTLATLPAPSEGTLGALLVPAALFGFPISQLALGLGITGVKIAIATRILGFLAGLIFRGRGADRGISVKKEFVHVPSRHLEAPPVVAPPRSDTARVLVAPPPPLQPGFFRAAPQSPFSLPRPYAAPGRTVVAEPPPPLHFVASRPQVAPTASFYARSRFPQFQASFPQVIPEQIHFVLPPPPALAIPAPPASDSKASSKNPLPGAQPATGGTFDQILRIAQSPAVSTIVSNNPDLIVRFIQGIAGVKPLPHTPLGTAHSNAGLTAAKVGNGDVEALLNFARQDPNLVRNIVRADPGFVPSIVNNILGISGQGGQQPTPAPPANFSDFDFKDKENDTADKSSDVPAHVPIDETSETPPPSERKPTVANPPPQAYLPPVGSHPLLGYPSTFYTIRNYQPSPYEAYGFPAGGTETAERPVVFSSLPWNTATVLDVLNMSKLAAHLNRGSQGPYTSNGVAEQLPSEPAALPVNVPSTKDEPQPSYGADVTNEAAEPPAVQAYGPSITEKPEPSYESASEQGPIQPEVSQDVTAVEEPLLEPDLPNAVDAEADVYSSVQQPSLSVDQSQHKSLPAEKETAVPPPVRFVFRPVTGKLDAVHESGRAVNMGSFPAGVYDPTALATEIKKSNSTKADALEPILSRRRRRTEESPLSQYLNTMRTVDSRKCVFKMVCFIGANDQSFGRYGENVSGLFRNVDSFLGSVLAADYSEAYQVGRTHGGDGCRIKYNTCPMSVVDLVSLSANFG
ncbi:uncharacterized protein LOC144149012 [Haemaphysalis longicornis]